MTKTFKATFAATLAAASLFGASAAFAGGDYYVGGSPDAAAAHANIDSFRTSGISNKRVILKDHQANIEKPYDHGDYRTMAPNGNN
ncbi:hypothetical protein [Shinella fusca]|jgi:hypothetical protein|uniref:DUF680 domain-containing protein n=1 Tax=Shinella fusca TaxID=544480 RepID=A0A7W7YXG2_9HYPH|nr:hypothetical protein [Shinella fusca]MBB5044169.1 hypothetical protein [Shinella fusca]